VWLSIIGVSWFWLIGMIFLTQFPAYTKNIINGDEKIVTLFLSVFSIGIAIGSVMCSKFLKEAIDGRLVPYGSFGITLSIILFFIFGLFYQESINHHHNIVNVEYFILSNPYGLCITLSLLSLSIFAGIYIVPLYAIIQHRSNKDHLSRIIAANNIINALFMVLATIATITLFTFNLNIDEILLLVGLVNIIVFFIIKKIVNKYITTRKLTNVQ
jgi:acyl-[acyl-carrier-protein]-phospholipid O-acyltransferase/long-chain-fatty-acid--[acyl-carrier-protein] ligase